MHWSTLILLTAGLAAPQATVEKLHFDSYTKAYHAAGAAHKPLLVVLNPSVSQVSTAEPITLTKLQADPRVGPLLDNYVVAVVDTGTEIGQEVHHRFGDVPLPFVAVIDERQEKQVYRSSVPPTLESIAGVVEKYKSGTAVAIQADAFANCPNCRKKWSNF